MINYSNYHFTSTQSNDRSMNQNYKKFPVYLHIGTLLRDKNIKLVGISLKYSDC